MPLSIDSDWPRPLQSAYIIQPHPHPTQFRINYNHSLNYEDASSMLLQNISVNLQNYTVSKPKLQSE
jgi:hypothetical protein